MQRRRSRNFSLGTAGLATGVFRRSRDVSVRGTDAEIRSDKTEARTGAGRSGHGKGTQTARAVAKENRNIPGGRDHPEPRGFYKNHKGGL